MSSSSLRACMLLFVIGRQSGVLTPVITLSNILGNLRRIRRGSEAEDRVWAPCAVSHLFNEMFAAKTC